LFSSLLHFETSIFMGTQRCATGWEVIVIVWGYLLVGIPGPGPSYLYCVWKCRTCSTECGHHIKLLSSAFPNLIPKHMIAKFTVFMFREFCDILVRYLMEFWLLLILWTILGMLKSSLPCFVWTWGYSSQLIYYLGGYFS